MWTLLEDADVLFDEDAFGFHQTVYQRLNKIIQYSDDSDGILGDAIFHCIRNEQHDLSASQPQIARQNRKILAEHIGRL